MKLKMFIVSLVVILMITTAFIGCKTATTTETTAATTAAATTETATETTAAATTQEEIKADITIWSFPGPSGDDVEWLQSIGNKFTEQFPGIKVMVELMTYDAGPDKVKMAIASGTTPDIVIDGVTRTAGYANQGVLVPLNDVVSNVADYFKQPIPDNIMSQITLNNEQFTFVFGTGSSLWAINKNLAEKLGVWNLLPSDRETWTWEDYKNFLKATAEAGKANGVLGTGLWAGSQSSDSSIFGFLLDAGGNVFNDAGTEIILNSPESVAMMDFLKGLIDEKLVPSGAATMKDDELDVLWFSKKIILSPFQGIGIINYIANGLKDGSIEEPFDVAFFELPSFEGKPVRKVGGLSSGPIVFDNKDESRIKASKKFIEYLLEQNMKDLVERAGVVPIFNDIKVYENNPALAEAAALMVKTTPHAVFDYNKNKPYWGEIRAIFFPEIQAIYNGTKTSQQALDDFVKNANAIVSENENK